jgi:hypothetical protein
MDKAIGKARRLVDEAHAELNPSLRSQVEDIIHKAHCNVGSVLRAYQKRMSAGNESEFDISDYLKFRYHPETGNNDDTSWIVGTIMEGRYD